MRRFLIKQNAPGVVFWIKQNAPDLLFWLIQYSRLVALVYSIYA